MFLSVQMHPWDTSWWGYFVHIFRDSNAFHSSHILQLFLFFLEYLILTSYLVDILLLTYTSAHSQHLPKRKGLLIQSLQYWHRGTYGDSERWELCTASRQDSKCFLPCPRGGTTTGKKAQTKTWHMCKTSTSSSLNLISARMLKI